MGKIVVKCINKLEMTGKFIQKEKEAGKFDSFKFILFFKSNVSIK